MPVADWVATEDWEVVFLGGKRMPGVANVEISLPSGLEVLKARGKKKARIRDGGSPPAEVNITLELLPAEMPDLERVVDLLRPRSPKGAKLPLEITHPNARLWGVNVVKIKTIGSPTPGPGGSFELKISALEHSETPTKVKKAKTTKPVNEDDEDWNVDPKINALRPGNAGAAAANFTPDQTMSFPGSGFG
jgi:hypothetical protein